MSAVERFPYSNPAPFSRATRAGGFLFLSGQIPYNANGKLVQGSIEDQTHAVIDRIEEHLQQFEASLADVVKACVWLDDLANLERFNQVYMARFGQHLPTRSLVQAKLAKNAGVEIEVQAYVG